MSDRPENPPAFPNHPGIQIDGELDEWLGMTLRDWFAGQALAGTLGNPGIGTPGGFSFGASHRETNEQIAHAVYALADAMLAARKEPQQ